MTYAPLWERDAAQSREAAALGAMLPRAYTQVAQNFAEHLQGDFPDVDAALIGWIMIRVSHGLNGLIRDVPEITGRQLHALTLLAGERLVDGAS